MPRILVPNPPDDSVYMWFSISPSSFDSMRDKYGIKNGFVEGKYPHFDFERLLAKIAHGFTIADQGPEKIAEWKLLLPDLILSKPKDGLNLIGSDQEKFPPGSYLHEVHLDTFSNADEEFLTARVHLFASMGAPRYRVVVAKRPHIPQAPV